MSNQTDLIDFIAELASNDADITLYYYELLRVHPSAEQEVIESAYRRLLRLYHPDVNKHPLANNVTKMLINAYEILRDSTKRAEYDAYLASNKNDRQSAFEVDREEQIAFLLERGEAYYTNGKADLAVQDFTRVIELDPYNDVAYQWRGMLCIQEGKHTLAVQDYTKAIDIDPSNWTAHQGRGWAHWYLGINNLAKQDLQIAQEGWAGIGAHETNIPHMLLGYGMRDGSVGTQITPSFSSSEYEDMKSFVEEMISKGKEIEAQKVLRERTTFED